MVGKNCRHCERQQRGEGKLASLRATRVGKRGEPGMQRGKTDSRVDDRCILHLALLVMDQVLATRILTRRASSFLARISPESSAPAHSTASKAP